LNVLPDYQGEMVDADCWAVEWVSDGGWESVMPDVDGIYASIPVAVSYNDGVIVKLVEPHTALDIDFEATT